MRIALVVTDLSNTRIGGISRVATEVGAHCAELGHDVTAYVLGRASVARPAAFRGIDLRYIEPFRTLNPDYPVVEFSRRAFRLFLQDAVGRRYDVIQSFNLNAIGAIASASALSACRIPLVISNYETLGMDVRAKLTEFRSTPSAKTLAQILFEAMLALLYECRYLKQAKRIITEDENTRSALLDMGIDAGAIRLIPNGVDVERARAAKPPAIDVRHGRAGPVIGYLGRVDPRKGVQYLLGAMPYVKRRYPGVTLFLAGGSRHGYDQRIRGLIARLDLADCVQLLGRVEEILPYYKLADVVVIPSLSEGIPITLGEAMASSVPVVITRLPGVVPFVKPADLVHWAECADSRSLGEAIVAALSDPDRAGRTARASNFISAYTWREVAKRHLAVYDEVSRSP